MVIKEWNNLPRTKMDSFPGSFPVGVGLAPFRDGLVNPCTELWIISFHPIESLILCTSEGWNCWSYSLDIINLLEMYI